MSDFPRSAAVVVAAGAAPAAFALPASGGPPPDAPCYAVEALLPLGGDASAAYGLNDLGLVVGSADAADGSTHAAQWQGDGTEDLGTMGGIDAIAFDVDAAGQVTGLITFDVGALVNRGFRRTGGTVEILEPLPLDSSAVGRAIAGGPSSPPAAARCRTSARSAGSGRGRST
jgi:probable HAF family extracellular repeat protein